MDEQQKKYAMITSDDEMSSEVYECFPSILPTRLYFRSLYDDVEGFRILLESDNGDVYKIEYSYVMMYKKSREGERFNSLGVLKSTAGIESVIYSVHNSKLLKWFDSETLGANKYTEGKLVHWSIITLDQWVDVLSFVSPEVTLLE